MTTPKLNYFYLFIIAIFLLNCKNDTKESIKTNPNYSKIDTLFQVCNEREIFNGNVIVSINDSIFYKKSFGYVDGSKKTLLNDSSIFRIGSVAKEFYGVSIMILEEEGLLSLEQTIDEFDLELPDWSNKIKIKHLLQYSSGLPRIDYENSKNDDDIYRDLKKLKKLKFEPGTNHNYNNNSIFIQKLIIEKISQLTFEEFVTKNIIRPLNLKNSIFDPEETTKNIVKSFNNNGVNDKASEFSFKGWLNLTNDDLHAYLNALHSGKIISNTSLLKIFKNNFEGRQSSLGFSDFNGNELVSHSHHGSSRNFEAFIHHNKQLKLTVTLTTNNKNFKVGEIASIIEQIIKNEEFEIPKKSVYLTIREKCYNNVDEGIKYYFQLKSEFPDKYNFSDSNELNGVGYKLIEKNKINDAITIFKLMVKEFPEDSNAYDSLAEAYMLKKQYDLALKNYTKSLQLNPKNDNAKNKIEEIKNKYL